MRERGLNQDSAAWRPRFIQWVLHSLFWKPFWRFTAARRLKKVQNLREALKQTEATNCDMKEEFVSDEDREESYRSYCRIESLDMMQEK